MALLLAAVTLLACGRSEERGKASLGSNPPGALASADPDKPVPKNKPAKGLIFNGLLRAEDGEPCEGMFELRSDPRSCTHGPDPAPPGVEDVRDDSSVRELRQLADPPLPAGENAPQDGDPGLGNVGSDPPLVPCVGNGTDGNRVQAVYAHPADADVPNRFAELESSITTWAREASGVFDASAAKRGGSRAVRWVTTAPSGGNCELTILNLEVPANADDTFAKTREVLRGEPYNLVDPTRRYLIWMESNVYCGIANMRTDARPGPENRNNQGTAPYPGTTTPEVGGMARVDEKCWGRVSRTGGSSTEAHELAHGFGAVQNDTETDANAGAPNSSGGGHCVDEWDLMCYSDEPNFPAMRYDCPQQMQSYLDCGENDYFNAGSESGYLATHWNVADSSFLLAGARAAPSNNNFAAAIPLTGTLAGRTGDYNAGANRESGEPNHAGNGGGASIWYRWTAPESGNFSIRTAGSSFDTVLGVYTGSAVGGLTEVAANDDLASNTNQSGTTFAATAGQTYRFGVDGFDGAIGAVFVSLAKVVPPQVNQPPPSTKPRTASPIARAPVPRKRCRQKNKRKRKKCRRRRR